MGQNVCDHTAADLRVLHVLDDYSVYVLNCIAREKVVYPNIYLFILIFISADCIYIRD